MIDRDLLGEPGPKLYIDEGQHASKIRDAAAEDDDFLLVLAFKAVVYDKVFAGIKDPAAVRELIEAVRELKAAEDASNIADAKSCNLCEEKEGDLFRVLAKVDQEPE